MAIMISDTGSSNKSIGLGITVVFYATNLLRPALLENPQKWPSINQIQYGYWRIRVINCSWPSNSVNRLSLMLNRFTFDSADVKSDSPFPGQAMRVIARFPKLS
jgi:hypothetical protein